MTDFTAHRLWFEGRALTPIHLGEHQGAAIRGALFHAIRGRPGRPGFCADLTRPDCRGCASLEGCAVSFLLATVDEDGRRGSDVPRPYTIEPPERTNGFYEPGETFAFGLTVFGSALAVFPYVVVGARRLEEEGIGRKAPDGKGIWRAGRFRIERIVAVNPFTGEGYPVLQRGEELVSVPGLPVRHEHVLARTHAFAAKSRLTLEFLTPMRLIEDGRPLRSPFFRPLVQRLIERLSSLWETYGEGQLPIDFADLMAHAEAVRLMRDETTWLEVRGYSTRQGAPKSLAGFVGRATYEGDFGPLLPWLVWGELIHVGKDAVKGCGRYRLLTDPPRRGGRS